MWVDGVYVKAGLEKEKAAVLVVMAALSDGSKVVVSAVPGYRESTENWSEVLRDIKRPQKPPCQYRRTSFTIDAVASPVNKPQKTSHDAVETLRCESDRQRYKTAARRTAGV